MKPIMKQFLEVEKRFYVIALCVFPRDQRLFYLCSFGYNELVKSMLNGVENIYKPYYGTETPLQIVLTTGNLEIVKWLVSEKKVELGNHSIRFACESGNLELVKYLVSQGSSPYFYRYWSNKGKEFLVVPALFVAIDYGYLDILKYLLLEKDDIALIRCLGIQNDSFGDNEYCDLLEYACGVGQLHIVKWLVEKKDFGLNKEGCEDMTPFLYAVRNGRFHVVKYLLSEGAEFEGKALEFTRNARSKKLKKYFATVFENQKKLQSEKREYNHKVKTLFANNTVPLYEKLLFVSQYIKKRDDKKGVQGLFNNIPFTRVIFGKNFENLLRFIAENNITDKSSLTIHSFARRLGKNCVAKKISNFITRKNMHTERKYRDVAIICDL